ncbi:MAG: class I SAM-dependent methyltransferase [Bacteroidetes bacterium]|nr:class I SAM-dependent methyltransferase [Bacteroidota bacterium]
MKNRRLIDIILTAAVFIGLSAQVSSQVKGNAKEFEPVVGQSGKDVVWVPTPQILVDSMLRLAKVSKNDFLIDLGSGDGRTVITAAKMGVRAIGIEYNPDMVELSKRNAAEEGVADKTEFIVADLFKYDFTEATVVTMFLLTDINLRLRPQLLEMKPGTRIVSNTFSMMEWIADDTVTLDDEVSWNIAYLWIVPADVDGKWKLQEGGQLILVQKFQMLEGELTTPEGKRHSIEGKLNGNDIVFSAGDITYTGRVDGRKISGSSLKGSERRTWSAYR